MHLKDTNLANVTVTAIPYSCLWLQLACLISLMLKPQINQIIIIIITVLYPYVPYMKFVPNQTDLKSQILLYYRPSLSLYY